MRKWLSISSVVMFLLVILAVAGVWQFKRVLNNLQIELLHYQVASLNFHHITFSELSLVHNSETTQHSIQLQNLTADWQWQSWLSPQLTVVSAKQVRITQIKRSDVNILLTDNAKPIFVLPENWSVPESFPNQIYIQTLMVKLPCAAAYCSLAGVLGARKIKSEQGSAGIELTVNVSPGEALNAEYPLNLKASYTVKKNLPTLDAKLKVNDTIKLQLSTHLENQKGIYWLGNLQGYAINPNEQWLSFLKKWGVRYVAQADQQNSSGQTISLATEWGLVLTPLINLPKTASLSDAIKAITGHWILDAKIPSPLRLDKLGEFSGNANINLAMSAGQLDRYALIADITAKQFVVPPELQLRGLVADTVHLNIKSQRDSLVDLHALPVAFYGDTQGALRTTLAGNVLVDVAAKKITVEQLNLSANAISIKPVTTMELNNVSIDLHATGFWQPERFELYVSAPSQITADILVPGLLVSAKSTQFSTAQLNISGNIVQGEMVWPQLTFTTEVLLKGGEFQHPQVNAKTWFWRGNAQGSLANFAAKGDLGVGTSLIVKHQAKRDASELTLDWKVPNIFLLAANPLDDILSIWPSLLTLSQGKINASGKVTFDIEKNKLINSNTEFLMADINGVYETLIFKGLSSNLKITTDENKVSLSTDKLTVNHVNKGFDFGPLTTAGAYKSSWDKIMQGKLNVQHFSGSAMGGSLSTAAQQFDFSRETQNFKLELKDISLANLLKQYSSSELSGTGQLSGIVPIEINRVGVRVVQGMVAAAPPGGQLQMKSERASAMAKNQPGMKLVVDALNDFHYTALASQINYDEKGKLFLAIKLEGSNPALERGRPINVNINLEEDVPAMLASIQLSSKVADIVKKRLQTRIQKKPTSVKASLKTTSQ